MEDKKSLIPTPVGAAEDDVTTWALPDGAIARFGRGSTRAIAFSADGQSFAVGSAIGLWIYEIPTLSTIALWDTERGMINTVTFSPDNRQIVTHTFAENVKIWDIERGICIAEVDDQKKSEISKPVFSADGQRIAAARYRRGKIYFWCPHTGKLIGETEIGETDSIYPVQFSSDISLLAGTKRDKDSDAQSIKVWNVETGEQICHFVECPDQIRNYSFSSDNRLLASGNSNGTIQVWDLESGRLQTTFADYGDAEMFPYHPPEGGLIAAAVFPDMVEVWNVENNEKLDEFQHRGNSRRACFSVDAKQLAVKTESEIMIWRKEEQAPHSLSTLHGHIGTVDSLVFSSDAKTIAAGFWRDNVLLWDVESRRSYRPQGEKLPATWHKVHLTPDSKIRSTNTFGKILNLWEVGNSEPIAELPQPEAGLLAAEAISPAGHRIACADGESNIHVWEDISSANDVNKIASWKKHTTLLGHGTSAENPVRSSPERGFSRFHIVGLAFSPDGKCLASISRDCKACLWDVDTGKRIAELPLTPPTGQGMYREYDAGIAFSPRGDVIAGGKWGEIVLWDASDGKTIMTFPQPEGSQRPITLCFSPCGKYLASGAWWEPWLKQVSIRLWEVASGENIATFWGHTTDVQVFAFTSDGTLLASGGHDGSILLWDLKSYFKS